MIGRFPAERVDVAFQRHRGQPVVLDGQFMGSL
jgi:hypothetical protein